VAKVCHPSYSQSGAQEDQSLRSAWAKFVTPHPKQWLGAVVHSCHSNSMWEAQIGSWSRPALDIKWDPIQKITNAKTLKIKIKIYTHTHTHNLKRVGTQLRVQHLLIVREASLDLVPSSSPSPKSMMSKISELQIARWPSRWVR
jgi:hypothetical protein